MPFDLIQYPFVGGLEQKKDPLNLEPPSFLTLTNCVRKKTGRIEKRRGNVALNMGFQTRIINLTGTLTTPRRLLAFGHQLCAIDGTYFYVNAGTSTPAVGEWNQRDLVPGCAASWQVISDTSVSILDPDVAIVSGKFACYAWTADGGVRLSIYEVVTGAPVVTDVLLNGTTGRPKCLALGTNLVVLADNGAGVITLTRVDLSTFAPTFTATSVTVVNDGRAASNFAWDADTDGSGFFWLAYERNAGPNFIRVVRCDSSGSILNAVAITEASSVFDSIGVTVRNDLWVGYGNNAVGLKFIAYTAPSTLTGATAATVISAGTDPKRIGIAELGIDGGTGRRGAVICADTDLFTSGTVFDYITDGPAVAAIGRMRDMKLLARPFLETTTNRVHVLTQFNSGAQPTEFLLDLGTQNDLITIGPAATIPRPVATIAPRSANSRSNSAVRGLSSVAHVAPMTATLAIGASWALVGTIATQFDRVDALAITADFSSRGLWASAETNSTLAFSCGAPSFYDGQNVVEFSYAHYPEQATLLTPSNVGGAMVSTGAAGGENWQYCFVYAWVDAQGNMVRSAPSVPQTSPNMAATAAGSVAITGIPMLKATAKQKASDGQKPRVEIEIYRTLRGPGSVFFRLPNGQLDNDPTVESINFTDTNPDSLVPGDGGVGDGTQPTLYTTGGVLENECPPSFLSMVEHKGRLFGLAGDGRTIWYTRSIVQGESPAFHDTLTIPIDEGGAGVALFSLDDSLLLFKTGTIFAIRGDGPADNGSGVDYTVQKVPTDVGCIEPRSLVLAPDGVCFQSMLGIHMLNRSMQVEWIGQPIVDTLATFPEITAATRVEDQHQIRFECVASNHLSGQCLVWDYYHGGWSVFSRNASGVVGAFDAPGVAAVAVAQVGAASNNFVPVYHWASKRGASWYVMQEAADGADYRDAGVFVGLSVQMGWIRVTGAQGYQRVRRIFVLGTDLSHSVAHGLTISVFSNYDMTSPDVYTLPNALVVGVVTPQEQFSVQLTTQKVEALSVLIQDTEPSTPSDTGEGPSLSGLALLVATKRGGARLPLGQVT